MDQAIHHASAGHASFQSAGTPSAQVVPCDVYIWDTPALSPHLVEEVMDRDVYIWDTPALSPHLVEEVMDILASPGLHHTYSRIAAGS